MVVKTAAKKGAKTDVKKDVKKDAPKEKEKGRTGVVDEDFEIDETERHTGVCRDWVNASGFGFIKMDTVGLIPGDELMVHWRDLNSGDRWPQLKRDLKVEFSVSKVKRGREWSVRAKAVSLPGGEDILVQDEKEESYEYIGDKQMRFEGKVKFYAIDKGFGYVILEDGYDIDEEVPKEFRIDREEISSGSQAPVLTQGMDIEFGIRKSKKGIYSCYNITQPGGKEMTREFAEGRNITPQSYKGKVIMWARAGFGYIEPDSLDKLPKDFQKAINDDFSKRAERAKKKGKTWHETPALFFRSGDKVDYTQRFEVDSKVSFKAYIDNRNSTGACEVAEA